MGFFAVLREPGDGQFQVINCHINVWSLASLLFRRVLVFDVGLLIEAQQPVSRIQLALPFGTDGEHPEDLTDLMKDLRIAELIFGEPTTIAETQGETKLNFGVGDVPLVNIMVSQADQILNARDFSIWRLPISNIAAG